MEKEFDCGNEYTPLISCVVAIYNVERYLDRCITSLLNQDYKNVEILLVNDGSTDSCPEICRKYAAEDRRVKVIDQPNGGANSARNSGLRAASGEWIYFADGDDRVTEDIFSALIPYLKMDYQMLLFSNLRTENGKTICLDFPEQMIEFNSEEDFHDLMISAMDRLQPNRFNYRHLDAVSIWNKVYRRSFLEENELTFIPGFPKLQDMSFNLMVYEKAKKALFINHVGYVYGINEGSVTKKYQKNFPEKMNVLIPWFRSFADNKAFLQKAYLGRANTIFRSSIVLYYCNPQNKKPYKIRKKEFLEMSGRYSEICDTDISYLPSQEKVLSFFVQKGLFFCCNLLNCLRNLLIK